MSKPPLQEFLYRIQPVRPEMLFVGPTSEEQAIVAEHVAYLEGLVKGGVASYVGRTTNIESNSFGIIVFQAASEEDARALMHRDPAVKKRVMRAELFPFRVVYTSDDRES